MSTNTILNNITYVLKNNNKVVQFRSYQTEDGGYVLIAQTTVPITSDAVETLRTLGYKVYEYGTGNLITSYETNIIDLVAKEELIRYMAHINIE